jgi:hypothetical protein
MLNAYSNKSSHVLEYLKRYIIDIIKNIYRNVINIKANDNGSFNFLEREKYINLIR